MKVDVQRHVAPLARRGAFRGSAGILVGNLFGRQMGGEDSLCHGQSASFNGMAIAHTHTHTHTHTRLDALALVDQQTVEGLAECSEREGWV